MHISENWIQLELDDLIRFIIGVKSIADSSDKYEYQNS